MATSSKTIQDWYAALLKEYYGQRYRAYLGSQKGGKDPEELYPKSTELGPQAIRVSREDVGKVPEEVREAYAFYYQHFEEADIGSARVYRVPAGKTPTLAVRVLTDGDDGYLEVYDAKGKFLAAGRTYIEVVAWGTREWLRAQAANPGDLPPELKDADARTLWGKPVSKG